MTERLQQSQGTGEPTILGFPVEGEEDAATEASGAVAAPAALTVLRRADPVAAGALVVAGVAANVSLFVPWWPGEGPPGLSLVRQGAEALDAGVDAAVRSVIWQPLVVVASGGVLVLLAVLLLVPARSHRFVGVLALVVSLAAATAVVLLLVDGGLLSGGLGTGMWCAVAVPVLGVLGALKAMLTAPLVTLDPVLIGPPGHPTVS